MGQTYYLAQLLRSEPDEKTAFEKATALRAQGHDVIVDAESILNRPELFKSGSSAWRVLDNLQTKGYKIKINQQTIYDRFKENAPQAWELANSKGWNVYTLPKTQQTQQQATYIPPVMRATTEPERKEIMSAPTPAKQAKTTEQINKEYYERRGMVESALMPGEYVYPKEPAKTVGGRMAERITGAVMSPFAAATNILVSPRQLVDAQMSFYKTAINVNKRAFEILGGDKDPLVNQEIDDDIKKISNAVNKVSSVVFANVTVPFGIVSAFNQSLVDKIAGQKAAEGGAETEFLGMRINPADLPATAFEPILAPIRNAYIAAGGSPETAEELSGAVMMAALPVAFKAVKNVTARIKQKRAARQALTPEELKAEKFIDEYPLDRSLTNVEQINSAKQRLGEMDTDFIVAELTKNRGQYATEGLVAMAQILKERGVPELIPEGLFGKKPSGADKFTDTINSMGEKAAEASSRAAAAERVANKKKYGGGYDLGILPEIDVTSLQDKGLTPETRFAQGPLPRITDVERAKLTPKLLERAAQKPEPVIPPPRETAAEAAQVFMSQQPTPPATAAEAIRTAAPTETPAEIALRRQQEAEFESRYTPFRIPREQEPNPYPYQPPGEPQGGMAQIQRDPTALFRAQAVAGMIAEKPVIERSVAMLADNAIRQIFMEGEIPSAREGGISYAERIREDAGQIPQIGNVVEGGEVQGGADLQRQAQVAPGNAPEAQVKQPWEMTKSEWDDATNLWHGTPKPFKGKPKTSRADLSLKGYGSEKDVFEGFYTANEPAGAMLYSQLDPNKIIPVRLDKTAKILDLSDSVISQEVLGTSGSLARSPMSSLEPPKKQFPFQNEFEDFAKERLNEAREKNGKPLLTENQWNNFKKELDPTNPEWNIQGLSGKYLELFIKHKGYDAIRMGRETVVLNPEKALAGYSHLEEVKQALSEGKPVPPEVLAEYPDLAKQVTHRMPTGEVMAGPEHPGAVPGSAFVLKGKTIQERIKIIADKMNAEADVHLREGANIALRSPGSMNLNPDIALGIMKKTASLLARGTGKGITFAKWADGILTEHGQEWSPYLQAIWDNANKIAAAANQSAQRGGVIPRQDTMPVPQKAYRNIPGLETVRPIEAGQPKGRIRNIITNPDVPISGRLQKLFVGSGLLMPGETMTQRAATKAGHYWKNTEGPWWKFVDKIEQTFRENLLPKDDPRTLSRALRRHNEMYGDAIENGVPNPNAPGRLTKGYSTIFEPLGDPKTDGFYDRRSHWAEYAIAERTIEELDVAKRTMEEKIARISRNKNHSENQKKVQIKKAEREYANILERDKAGDLTGIGEGRPDSVVAREIIDEVSQNPELRRMYDETSARYQEFAHGILEYGYLSGRISQETYEGLKAKRSKYVDIHRYFNELDSDLANRNFPVTSSGIGTAKEIMHQFKGGRREIMDPAINLLMSTYQMMHESNRNGVMLALRNFVAGKGTDAEGNATWLSAFAKKVEPVKIHGKMKIPKNSIEIFVNGKPEYWQFEDMLYKSLKNLEMEKDPKWFKAITALPRLMREATVMMPQFAIRNLIRDSFERSVFSEHGSKPWDSLTPMNAKELSDAKRYGGVMGGFYMKDPISYSRFLKSVLHEKDPNSVTMIPELWEKYEKLITSSEQRGRMGEYRRAFEYAKQKLGYDEVNAGLYAADKAGDLPNFTIAGQYMRTINKMIPFSNAALQGLFRAGKAFKNKPGAATAKFATYILMPKLIEFLWNNQDEESRKDYQSLEPHRKDMFLNFRIGPDQWIKIPLGFEMAVLAGGVTRSMDKYFNDNPDAMAGYFHDAWQAATPLSISDIRMPGEVESQIAANYDPYFQKHIIPPYQEGMALSERKGIGKASLISQGISAAMMKSMGMEADPRMIDHWFRGYLTNTWKTLSSSVDVVGGKEEPENLMEGVVGLFAESPGYGSSAIQDLYEKARYYGEMNSPRMRHLGKLVGKAAEEKDPQERERKKRNIIRVAQEYLNYYKSKDLNK